VILEDHMLITAALLASAIATAKPHPQRAAGVDSSEITMVEVQNDRKVPVTVYAQDSWGETRLGVVPADSTITLRVRTAFVGRGDIDFFVQPRGQPEEETGYMEVRQGERLGIVVPPR
jgi:hypothetical protein